MKDLLPQIEAWQATGDRVAEAVVVRVTGSAPREVGARMIVSSGGRMAGSVSGGCVETALYGEMMDLLAGSSPRVLRFGITEDMIWDVGLACGGVIDVLIHELPPALVAAFRDQASRGDPFALVATVKGQEAPGDLALVTPLGVLYGTVSPAVVAAGQSILARRLRLGVVEAVGGDVEVFIEPFLPPPVLLVIGGVHVAISLVRLAKEMGFFAIVVDPREKFANRERFPEADEILVEWPDEALAHLKVDQDTYIALLTHDPKIDEPTLAAALKTQAAYIGAIGSRKTHAERIARMAHWGVTADQLRRVHGPIGLDLGGRTPAETALSIMAEVVAVRNGRSGEALRAGSGPIRSTAS